MLIATSAKADSVQLQFDPSPDKDVAYYSLHRSKDKSFSQSEAEDIGLNTSPTITIDGIGSDYFRVSATDESGNTSDFSNTVEAKDTRPPTAPRSLRLFGAN